MELGYIFTELFLNFVHIKNRVRCISESYKSLVQRRKSCYINSIDKYIKLTLHTVSKVLCLVPLLKFKHFYSYLFILETNTQTRERGKGSNTKAYHTPQKSFNFHLNHQSEKVKTFFFRKRR